MLNTSGISIIVCCYNSAKRIPETFAGLAEQQIPANIGVELILVDNASTDQTAELAEEVWKNLGSKFELVIVEELTPGLSSARKKGINQARYPFILFCDDDNKLCPEYVNEAYSILSSDSKIAACGGCGMPVFETDKPFWFDEYAEAFALGSQEIGREDGKILNLYGAGLAINKQVLIELQQSGFKHRFTGRLKNKLSSSEDTELTNAMVLLGYELVYSEKLKFYHYMPKERMTFDYLKKLFVAFGTDGPLRNLYYSYISNRASHKLIRHWSIHLVLSLIRLVKYLIVPPKKFGREIYFKWSLAYIKELFSIREDYEGLKINALKTLQHGLNPSVTGIKLSKTRLEKSLV